MNYRLPQHIIDKTTPKAQHEYRCDWAEGSHTIAKGDTYVRVVYKDADGHFQSDHICVNCWSKM